MNFPSPHLIYQKLRVWKWWYDSRLCRLLYAGWPNSSFPLLTLCPRSGLNKSLQIFHWICEVHFATVQCKFFLTLVNDDNNKVQGFWHCLLHDYQVLPRIMRGWGPEHKGWCFMWSFVRSLCVKLWAPRDDVQCNFGEISWKFLLDTDT